MSPEKEKNSLMSCTVALRETLVTFTVLTWKHYKLQKEYKEGISKQRLLKAELACKEPQII
jgi:hypothetical protein